MMVGDMVVGVTLLEHAHSNGAEDVGYGLEALLWGQKVLPLLVIGLLSG